ncbi:acyltransferase [Roseimicrobium sp. ORNL1]|uniref:acyltransferase family protein n=1 Tax=Roseimicrobium sp. ORNL1 TaxID=2711231 RepID=UPI0013E1C394|nr:acyltransferase [Roseimicrobium sp. ORNL1]QIF02926.1 acyltransferase [Roseimicrobium sp. ORNL1]
MSEFRVDVLRGLAALGVVFYHVRSELWVGWNAIRIHPENFTVLERLLAYLGLPMRFMGAGVVIFFVLSGFCIHKPQAERIHKLGGGKESACPTWSSFYLRRFLRIFPPYLAALVLSGVVLVVVGALNHQSIVRWLASVFMMQNYVPPGGQVASNPSLWSLPVEMELYVAYPAVWWMINRLGCSRMLVFVGSVSAVSIVVSLSGVRWLGGNFLNFWVVWCAGAWVAERSAMKRLPGWTLQWGLIFAGTLTAACASEMMSFPAAKSVSLLLWGAVGVLALIWASSDKSGEGWLDAAWPARALAKVGVFSYSLYLVHYPLFFAMGHWWKIWTGDKPSNLLVAMAGILISVGAAWIFYILIERPSHVLARRLGQERKARSTTLGPDGTLITDPNLVRTAVHRDLSAEGN